MVDDWLIPGFGRKAFDHPQQHFFQPRAQMSRKMIWGGKITRVPRYWSDRDHTTSCTCRMA